MGISHKLKPLLEDCYIIKEIRNHLEFVRGRKIAVWGMGALGGDFLREARAYHMLPEDQVIECYDLYKDEYPSPEKLNGKRDEYFVIVSFLKGYLQVEKDLA